MYLALSQGVVDAQENPLPTIQAKRFYEVQSDINLTGHITDALLTIVGGPAREKIDDADEEILFECFSRPRPTAAPTRSRPWRASSPPGSRSRGSTSTRSIAVRLSALV